MVTRQYVRAFVGCCLRNLGLAFLGLVCASAALADDLPKGNAEAGAKLFGRYCKGCHGEDGQGGGQVFMPHVNNLTRKGYIEKLPDEYLLLAMTKGGPGIGKSNYMPSFEGTLKQEQMLDIIAHIRSLPTY